MNIKNKLRADFKRVIVIHFHKSYGGNPEVSTIIIVVGLFFILSLPVILFIDIKYKDKHNFQCTKCFHIYDIYENQCISYRKMGRLYVKCPKCKKYSAVKFIRKE